MPTRKKAAPEPEPEEEAVPASRSRMWLHEGMKDWLDEQTGDDIDTYSAADIISLAFAQRNAWRQSDEYEALIAEHGLSRRNAPEAPAKPAKAAAGKKAPAKAAAKPAAKPARAARGKKAAAAEDDTPFE